MRMFDPLNKAQMQRLVKSVRASHRALDEHREKRRELVTDYSGEWSVTATDQQDRMPVNMMALMVDIYVMHLAGAVPQVILPTFQEELLPFAATMEAVVNEELRTIGFDRILRKWVTEAIFSIGVAKCGLTDAEYIEIVPGEPQPGQDYFIDIVDFDDFVYDTKASAWSNIRFIGDRYRVDYDALMESDAYDKKAKEEVRVAEQSDWQGDGIARTDDVVVSKDLEVPESELWKRTAWLWDICLPEEGIVLTVADSVDRATRPLKIVEWSGPTNTPYHTLYFTEIPSTMMPLPPGQVLKGLNEAINKLYRKLIAQAGRQKTLVTYREGEEADSEKLKNARDGELVGLSHPDSTKEVMFGGAAQENLAFAIHLGDVYSRMAGNLDALGGLGPQSDTAKQDQMIYSQVSQKAARMTRQVVDATTDVVRDLMFHIWHDPVKTYRSTRRIEGVDAELEVVIEPFDRDGTFEDFNVKIEPYSMTYRTPQQRAKELTDIVTQLAFPMLPMLQEQGINLNLQRLFEMLSKYMNLPELNQVLEYSGMSMPGLSGTKEEGANKPANTHRTYERISRPGATHQGNNQVLQQIMLGGNPQESQRAAVGRPTGA